VFLSLETKFLRFWTGQQRDCVLSSPPATQLLTASGEGGDSLESGLAGDGDYRCAVRGGDVDLLPVAGMPPGTGGVPAPANVGGTIAQDRFRDQSPVVIRCPRPRCLGGIYSSGGYPATFSDRYPMLEMARSMES